MYASESPKRVVETPNHRIAAARAARASRKSPAQARRPSRGTPGALTEVELSRLERVLDRPHELVGVGAVDQAMVERQREIAGRADAQRVLAVLVLDDHGPLLDRADAQDRDLRLGNDRRSEERAE